MSTTTMSNKSLNFHFSGICGAGMGNVAALLHQAGHQIKGSDSHFFPPMSDFLQDLNIKTYPQYSKENILKDFTPDYQIISNVLSKNHEEVLSGKEKNIPFLSFPEVLSKFILQKRESIVISGTHGKTTTSSLLSQMLSSLDPGYFIGGILKDDRPGCKLGSVNAPFILEGDEYDTAYFDKHSKFLHYNPKYLVITHLEWDHVDIFPTFEAMLKEFHSLLKLVPKDGCVVYYGDQPILKKLMDEYDLPKISYGFEEHNHVQIKNTHRQNNKTTITLQSENAEFNLTTNLLGDIYALNLTASWIIAKKIGLDPKTIQTNLGTFCGAKRRLEQIRTLPFPIFSDFAHHPTAIEATIKILKQEFPNKKIWAIFDPRNATSRRNIFAKRITEALSHADRVGIGPTMIDERIPEKERFDGNDIAHKIGSKAEAFSQPEHLIERILNETSENIILVIMSCGAFHGLLQELQK